MKEQLDRLEVKLDNLTKQVVDHLVESYVLVIFSNFSVKDSDVRFKRTCPKRMFAYPWVP
jgi:hypothetical protein